GSVDVLAATVNATGLSPTRSPAVVIVIHGAVVVALHWHRSWSGPPHDTGMLCCSTANEAVPPVAGTAIGSTLVAYVQPACSTRTFWPAVAVGQRSMRMPLRGAS